MLLSVLGRAIIVCFCNTHICRDHDTLRTYSSEDVRSRICSGDPSWRDLVAPEVAALIDRHGYFGRSC